MYKSFVKRFADIVIASVAILVLALPMFVIAVAIKLDSKGPVLFRQKRIGRGKKHFFILKFRTMRIDTPHDAPTHELQDPKNGSRGSVDFYGRPAWMNCLRSTISGLGR